MITSVLVFIIVILFSSLTSASPGDNHYVYRACLNHCKQINCSTPLGLEEFQVKQTLFEYIFQWSCPDECAYQCMWKTLSQIGSVFQFHGKWPFVRILGIQEPASTCFSILNLLSNYFFGYRVLRRQLIFGVHPLYPMWLIFCLISMNAWIWSTIFHARDKPLTEIFDYLAAISLVFTQFACCLIRVGYRTKYMLLAKLATLVLFIFFLYHAYYLLAIKMDFGYNMMVNIIVGLLNVICWLTWSAGKFLSGRVYVWRCALSVALTMAFVGLELADFPPIAWLIDAHSLWHFSTICLPFIWYRFVVDDCNYLLSYPN